MRDQDDNDRNSDHIQSQSWEAQSCQPNSSGFSKSFKVGGGNTVTYA